MNKNIESLEKTRLALLQFISDLSVEELNKVPEGFNNNIIWNVGHLLLTQQGICYGRANLPVNIDPKFTPLYKPGSKPEAPVSAEEVEEIKTLFLQMVKQFEADVQKQIFTSYTPWTTRFGIELTNIEQAADFVIFHEGLHFGYIMALKKAVRK